MARPWAPRPAAGMLAMRTGDNFEEVVPHVQPTPGAGVFEPIAPTPPVDTELPFVRPFTCGWPSYYPPGGVRGSNNGQALKFRLEPDPEVLQSRQPGKHSASLYGFFAPAKTLQNSWRDWAAENALDQ